MKCDILIIGAGVVGCAIARELSRLDASVVVVEANADACMEASGANSGIVHAGYDCKPHTLKAKFNVRGCELYPRLATELDFPYKNCGSLVVATQPEQLPILDDLLSKGRQNNVPNLSIVSGEEARRIEPCISELVISALYAPSAGIVGPYEFGFACLENAVYNGARFLFNFWVSEITKQVNGFTVHSGSQSISTSYIINVAGVNSDDIARMVGDNSFKISGRRGEYILYDKSDFISTPIFPVPSSVGKGILIAPTVHGNMYIGPTGEDTPNKHNADTTAFGINKLLNSTDSVLPFNKRASITSFCGVRAIALPTEGSSFAGDDFIIGQSKFVQNFFNVAGICSPGLTSAPAIAEHMLEQFVAIKAYPKKSSFNAKRTAIKSFAEASEAEKVDLLSKNRQYGNIICRCETISEAEIVQAVKRGATTVDGVKRRVRAGAGRCQGGFCMPKVVNIIARELGLEVEAVTKKGEGSAIVLGNVKEVRYER